MYYFISMTVNIKRRHKSVEIIGNEITVYTDGACSNNGYKNARAGIGVYFGDYDIRNISMRLGSGFKQTNNVAELVAICEAIKTMKNEKYDRINIYTDSTYAIKCCLDFGEKVINENKTDAPNFDIIKKLHDLKKDMNINFMHIYSHTKDTDIHSIGNEYANKLATDSIK